MIVFSDQEQTQREMGKLPSKMKYAFFSVFLALLCASSFGLYLYIGRSYSITGEVLYTDNEKPVRVPGADVYIFSGEYQNEDEFRARFEGTQASKYMHNEFANHPMAGDIEWRLSTCSQVSYLLRRQLAGTLPEYEKMDTLERGGTTPEIAKLESLKVEVSRREGGIFHGHTDLRGHFELYLKRGSYLFVVEGKVPEQVFLGDLETSRSGSVLWVAPIKVPTQTTIVLADPVCSP